ncbi:right-handed parallel beta-helix repeat-containing protein [Planosporangium thailandense]|uniref:Right-handed parallel beta-helix repeat-containing protein n=1 Tax=Planosporangium thailandense TaxID=765197 RepID=A0ABX0Y7P2_9ACTN|nr:right-handed parallel beta-helix repeat-containing protein [Planosporangium thailandense]NJC73299.1 right-handed parallel beta-helix repeat-containing protein [Planosporangium thailandense]
MSQRNVVTDVVTRTRNAAESGIFNVHDHRIAGNGHTNDQPALQALVDELGAAVAADGRPRSIYCPPGVYLIRDTAVVWRSGVSLIGSGPAVTRFVLDNSGNPREPVPLAWFTAINHGASRDNHLADCTFAAFEVDGSRVDLPEYNPLAKGLGLQYVVRGRFDDLYIHDTVGTGFGCDHLQDAIVHGVTAMRCGRLVRGDQMGGAGIGIGVGGWGDIERLTIWGCATIGNGTNGIFVELQESTWSRPRGIRITDCHAEGNRFGISDWGANGLVVNACTMIANHEAGYDLSSMGTTSVAGRGGLVANCVIDGNIRDGLAIGNTPGPYTFSGNRISGNGRYGYWQHNVGGGHRGPAGNIVLTDNEIWANALAGIRLDAELDDATLLNNRIRDNGQRAAPAASGGGDTVSYTARTLVDTAADWLENGHMGKDVTVGEQRAVVVANSATELVLAPTRPGAKTSWTICTPLRGSAYRLPDSPAERPGVCVAAMADHATKRGNRVWDSQQRKRQTHGIWVTEHGRCRDSWATDNNFDGNAYGAARFDTAPEGGCWRDNLGLDGPA